MTDKLELQFYIVSAALSQVSFLAKYCSDLSSCGNGWHKVGKQIVTIDYQAA